MATGRYSPSTGNPPNLGNGKALSLFESFPPDQQLEALHKYGRYLEYLSRRGVEIYNPEAHSLRFMENFERKQRRRSSAQKQQQVEALIQYSKLLEKLRQKGEEIRNPISHLHVFLTNFHQKRSHRSLVNSDYQYNDAQEDDSSQGSREEFQEESSSEGDDDAQAFDEDPSEEHGKGSNEPVRLPVSSITFSGKAHKLLYSLPTQESRDEALEWCDAEVFELRNRGEEVINPDQFMYHKMRWFIKMNKAEKKSELYGAASAKPESVLGRLRKGESLEDYSNLQKSVGDQSERGSRQSEVIRLPVSSIVVEGKALDLLNSFAPEDHSQALAYCDDAVLETRQSGEDIRNPKQFVFLRMRRFATGLKARGQPRSTSARETRTYHRDAFASPDETSPESLRNSHDVFGDQSQQVSGVTEPVRLPVSSVKVDGKALELLNSLPTPESRSQALEWCDGALLDKRRKGEEIMNPEHFLCSRIRRFVNEEKDNKESSVVETEVQRQFRLADDEEVKRLKQALEEAKADLEQSLQELKERNIAYALLNEKYVSDKSTLERTKECITKFHGEKDLLLERLEQTERLLDTRTKEKSEVEANNAEKQARLEEISTAFVKVKNELLAEQVARQDAEERINQLTELKKKYESEKKADGANKDDNNTELHGEIATLKANLQQALELLNTRTIEHAQIVAKQMGNHPGSLAKGLSGPTS